MDIQVVKFTDSMLTHITAIIYQLFELVTLIQQVFPTILQIKFLNIPQQTSLRKVLQLTTYMPSKQTGLSRSAILGTQLSSQQDFSLSIRSSPPSFHSEMPDTPANKIFILCRCVLSFFWAKMCSQTGSICSCLNLYAIL